MTQTKTKQDNPLPGFRDEAQEDPKWIIDGVMPLGDLVIFAGRTGVGKGQLGSHLVASVTNGKPFAPGTKPAVQGKALVFWGERSKAQICLPRLEMAGADPDKTTVYARGEQFGSHTFDSLSSILEFLKTLPSNRGVRLVLIDTADNWELNIYHAATVRNALQPFQDWAQDAGATVVFVTHLDEKTYRKASLGAVAGSQVWFRAVSGVWFVSYYNSDRNIGMFWIQKNTPGKAGFGWHFSMESGVVKRTQTHAVKLNVGDAATQTIADFDDEHRGSASGVAAESPRERAKAFLENYAWGEPSEEIAMKAARKGVVATGAAPNTEVEAAAYADRIDPDGSLRRAMEDAGVVSVQSGGRHWWVIGTAQDAEIGPRQAVDHVKSNGHGKTSKGSGKVRH